MPGESRTHYWEWSFSGESPSHRYLVPGVLDVLHGVTPSGRVLDIGCGNGELPSAHVARAGYGVTGIDFEESGLERARVTCPGVYFATHDLAEPLPEHLRGAFDVVVSAEVIEHLFFPRYLFSRAREALRAGGHLVVTTPYHGYTKNLSLALVNRFDTHWSVGSDYGHIKFFSRRSLGAMACECGFEPLRWQRVGRVPPLAASMIMTAAMTPRSV